MDLLHQIPKLSRPPSVFKNFPGPEKMNRPKPSQPTGSKEFQESAETLCRGQWGGATALSLNSRVSCCCRWTRATRCIMRTVLYTEVDAQCDKGQGRRSKVIADHRVVVSYLTVVLKHIIKSTK